ncbi:DUF2345 domain-containing protein, partial [Francisella tularensis subsp. holarctica]|uniref:hypothetical protein n=1 Tax=Francisella tularensis TaxID=263 RepID=UPI0023819E6B
IRLDKKDKLKLNELFRAKQELTLNAGKTFIRIDSKNIETYYSDKPTGGGVLLPQGFRKKTKIDLQKIESE